MKGNVQIFVIILNYVFINVIGEEEKRSVAFVIDDTFSMSNDIDRVKSQTKQMFDAVFKSDASNFGEFVLVTFNDYATDLFGSQVRIKTNNADEFRRALDSLNVHGGLDCPENALLGIMNALNSIPSHSVIYVFTDAAAKDYDMFEEVKSLSQKKSIQVTFLLTGICASAGLESEKYLVYHKIAEATSGQVFHLKKCNVDQVIAYILETIKSERNLLAQDHASECPLDLPFVVDGKTSNVMISASKIWDISIYDDCDPHVDDSIMSIKVADSENNDVESYYVLNLPYAKILHLRESKPGKYTAKLNCHDTLLTYLVVTGATTVLFQHGFSTNEPKSTKETSTLPLPGEKSFVSIVLDNPVRDVTLNTLEFIDVDGKVIGNVIDLRLVDVDQQFYTTTANVNLPDKMFKIKVNGQTTSKEEISRVGVTFIEPQKIFGNIDNMAPKVTIIGDTKVIIEPNMPVTLKCTVEAYPKPDIFWENNEAEQFHPDIITVDMSGLYSSVLQIEKTIKNATYYCKAKNSINEADAYVEIGIIKRDPDNKLPKVTIIGDTEVITQPNKYVTLKCSVEANTKPQIIWESDKGEQFRPEIITVDIVTGLYSSILQIKECCTNATYYCRAENSIGKAEAHAQIGIIEEPPLIQGTKRYIYSVEEDMIDIPCTVIKGNPIPIVEWFKNSKKITDGSKYQILKNHTLRFKAQASDHTDFTCVAENHVGSHEMKFQVTVYAKPEIEDAAIDTIMNIAENEMVHIPCHATGNPPPDIQWVGLKNLDRRKNPFIYREHTLRFKATLSDSGTYTCEAKNHLGETKKMFHINAYVPVRVHVPGTTTINVLVGEPLHLPCSASGYPEPTAKLTFISNNSKSQDLKIGLPGEKIILEETFTRQERSGDYVCSASNDFSSSNFTYHVEIEAPPYIVDKWSNEYNAVAGDLALRIPCKVRGNPKPIITWSINGLPVANTASQIIDGDGTLILLKPDIHFSGSYTCEAVNSFSKDAKTVTVEIRPYPEGPGRGDVVSQILIEEGKASPIICGVPHKPVDLVRWFKDGKEIQIGEIQLENPLIRDKGLYTCRVSTATKSESYHTNVIVGFKPRFISPGPAGPIEYIEGSDAFLDCSAQAQPDPQIKWTHNNQRIFVPSLDYKITHMKTNHIGVYKCTVSNSFGFVSRVYRIKSGECQLSLADFTGFQPLILSETLRWPNLEIQKGSISVPVEKPLLLLCPESSFDYPGLEAMDKVKATCIQNSMFDVRGRDIKFSDLKCKKEIVAYARPNEIHCLPSSKRAHSELYTVGYKHNSRFIGVYDICFDNEDNVPVFARHSFILSISNEASKGEPPFANGIDQPHDYTQLYDPSRQIRTLSSVMGREFDSNSCHFAKKQLIISRDVIPGLSQTATFNYLNVMPHWSVCYQQNWEEVENRVRDLLSSFKYAVYIWTGTLGRMRLPGQKTDTDIYLSDDSDNRQYVPLYLWKVIQSYTAGIVAIIQINVPNLTTSEAEKYVRCSDICHQIGWLRNTEWHDAKKGYTFCCSIDDFENNFNFIGMFKGPRNVLGM